MAYKPQPRRESKPRPSWREDAQRRGTPAERGYDQQWRRFSEQYRKSNPTCIPHLLREGRMVPSEHVHHIQDLATHPQLKYEPTNLLATCKECHERITCGRLDRRGMPL